MGYTLIKGEFHIYYPDLPRQGPEPDGDTLKFLPDDPTLVEDLQGWADFNGRHMINTRFEGLDALETHFSGMHQNMEWAENARDRVLQRTGFGEIRFWADLPAKVHSVQYHPKRGYVLARSCDGHGRIISFVYPGETNRSDGSDVFLDANLLNQSLNAKLLSAGLAYPLFYTTLPVDLQRRLMNLAIVSWNNQRGLWPFDTANAAYWQNIANVQTLQTLVLWPKLFRRLAKYFAAGHSGLGGFDAWLREDPRDRDDRILLPTGEVGNMHDVLETDGNWIHMNYWPEEIVILPDDA